MSRFTVTPVSINQQNVSVGKTEKKTANNRMLHVKVNNDTKSEQQKSENGSLAGIEKHSNCEFLRLCLFAKAWNWWTSLSFLLGDIIQ